MATLTFSNNTKNNRATVLLNAIQNGTLVIYSGTRPATPDTAFATNVVALCNITIGSNVGSVSNGVLTLSTLGTGTASVSSGTAVATFARINSASGVVVLDGDVATTGAVFNINTTTISNGLSITCSGGTIVES